MKALHPLRKITLTTLGLLALSPALLFASGATSKLAQEHGVLQSVDPETHTLTLAQHKNHAEEKFQWNDQTRFREQNKSVGADALKSGEHLRFTYLPGGTTPVLQSVNILPAKTKPHSANHRPENTQHRT